MVKRIVDIYPKRLPLGHTEVLSNLQLSPELQQEFKAKLLLGLNPVCLHIPMDSLPPVNTWDTFTLPVHETTHMYEDEETRMYIIEIYF